MNYIIEAPLNDGINWYMGVFPAPDGSYVPKWSPYYEDAVKLELETAKEVSAFYDLEKSAGADIKHISDAKIFQSASVITDSFNKYMSRPVRIKKLNKGDVFIEGGIWRVVTHVRRGQVLTKYYGKDSGSADSYPRRSNLWVNKIFLNTKTPIK